MKKYVTFNDYKECVKDDKNVYLGEKGDETHNNKIYSFIAHKMKTYSVERSKIALSSHDDKQIPMETNKFYTYAIGHYTTKARQ